MYLRLRSKCKIVRAGIVVHTIAATNWPSAIRQRRAILLMFCERARRETDNLRALNVN